VAEGDDKLKAPSREYLGALQTELEDLYRSDDDQLDAYRAQRELRVPAMQGADEKYTLVQVDPRDPDVSEEAFQQAAMLTLERPKIHLEAGESDTAQTNASIREHWTEETLWACGTREPGTDTMFNITDATLNDGGGWSKILWQRDVWDQRYAIKAPNGGDVTGGGGSKDWDRYDTDTEDAKKRAGPPFAWIAVDARLLYPVWSGGRLCEVLEVKEVPLRSTLRRYRLALDNQGNVVPEELGQPEPSYTASNRRILPVSMELLEHWDEEWCTWAISGSNYHGQPTGAIVKQFRHGYPFGVPYDFAPGLWMHHWKNRKVGWGISQTKLWLVQYRQYLRAMHAQYVARDLLSPLVNFGDTNASPVIGNDGKPRDRDPGPLPGEIVNLGPGRQLQRIQYPDATTLEKHMSLVDQAISQLESPRVTELGGMEGAGFAISQVLSYSRTRVGPIAHNIETLLKGQTEKLWDLVRHKAGERVWVGYSGELSRQGYIGVDPEDLDRPVRIRWEVQQELPTDEMIRARYAHERLQAGTWGTDETIEYLGDNPDEIRRSKQRDRIRQSPEYLKWLDAQVFMFAGRGDILGTATQAAQYAQQGQLPGAGVPQGQPQPGVFEGGQPGLGAVPDLGALAAAPNGAGVNPPAYGAVVNGAAQASGPPVV
jgi:hypothetical protein